MEKNLFSALRDNGVRSPSVKEFDESYAFVNGVRSSLPKHMTRISSTQNDSRIDLVLDVAGGHGALAALFLLLTSAQSACVIDPARVGKGGVAKAWSKIYSDQHNKSLIYRHECLRTGLPSELEMAINTQGIAPQRILVVACHACQHLSEETIQISQKYGVHCAVAPCCQKDSTMGSPWKQTARNLNVNFATTMDLLLAGKSSATTAQGKSYSVRIRVIDPKITPQNRIIVCRCHTDAEMMERATNSEVETAHRKLERTYRRAHRTEASTPSPEKSKLSKQCNKSPAILGEQAW
eukprot:CAMPEP_0172470522 /NCGR_PEP_ID=MMETSP1065-20121228/66564_1 /TAXON_ID=265537 /ORGANISM="Amphiprora paludosa, Strain CCMP125" /LENGTH=293 /DNA_ID=CAMNT_0013228489 /DNA_START=256 /DNA_END=1134 /DNA_ORIENTATION=-